MDKIIHSLEKKKQLALAETTPEDILRELSEAEEPEIRKAVAGNPNTPVDVLQKVGKKFPEVVRNNPIFDLLFLENSDSYFIKISLARSSTTSLKTLLKLIEEDDKKHYIENDKKIKIAVLANPKLNSETLESIAHSYVKGYLCNDYYLAIARNPNTSATTLDLITERASSSVEIHIEIARHPNTATSTLEKLDYQLKKIRLLILQHPNA